MPGARYRASLGLWASPVRLFISGNKSPPNACQRSKHTRAFPGTSCALTSALLRMLPHERRAALMAGAVRRGGGAGRFVHQVVQRQMVAPLPPCRAGTEADPASLHGDCNAEVPQEPVRGQEACDHGFRHEAPRQLPGQRSCGRRCRYGSREAQRLLIRPNPLPGLRLSHDGDHLTPTAAWARSDTSSRRRSGLSAADCLLPGASLPAHPTDAALIFLQGVGAASFSFAGFTSPLSFATPKTSHT